LIKLFPHGTIYILKKIIKFNFNKYIIIFVLIK